MTNTAMSANSYSIARCAEVPFAAVALIKRNAKSVANIAALSAWGQIALRVKNIPALHASLLARTAQSSFLAQCVINQIVLPVQPGVQRRKNAPKMYAKSALRSKKAVAAVVQSIVVPAASCARLMDVSSRCVSPALVFRKMALLAVARADLCSARIVLTRSNRALSVKSLSAPRTNAPMGKEGGVYGATSARLDFVRNASMPTCTDVTLAT